MISFTGCSGAWRLEKTLEPSPGHDLVLAGAALAGAVAVLHSGDSGLWRAAWLLLLLGLVLRARRRRPLPVHLRITPAVMHLRLSDGRMFSLLPPYRALVLPFLVSLYFPRGRFRGTQVFLFPGQFSAGEWRLLRILLRNAG